MIKELICISCPLGCHLSVDTEKLTVTGNSCKREKSWNRWSKKSSKSNYNNSKGRGALHPVLPVKTKAPIPKALNFKCIEELNKITLKLQ